MDRYTIVARKDELSLSLKEALKEKLDSHLIWDTLHPQLVISIGGDGTMLESVHTYLREGASFVGLHTGTLGFFTDYKREEVDQLVSDILKKEYRFENRNLLDVNVYYNQEKRHYYALNEVRFDHGFMAQVMDVYINGELLETFRGNGVCVSTPSGSTAYNKSLGGAIIYPGQPLMQLTEVAGIGHNAYRSLGSSLILTDKQVICLKGKDLKNISVDHLSYSFDHVDKIEISLSSKVVPFIEYRQLSFIQRIRRAFIYE
ncbi:NAD kinase [Tannockella kyphosi]|uniref:NAD kinase n=1 Tax=Tannockella kyphosi TaxID=2899121 RepID=UPI0020122F5C|nr:NAD kinase [Tannockella kyphosi]